MEKARAMSPVSVTIDGRKLPIACIEGEEARVESAAGMLDDKIREMRESSTREIPEQRLVIMAALTIADDLAEARNAAAAERKRGEETERRAHALASSLDELSSRIGQVAARLSGGAEG